MHAASAGEMAAVAVLAREIERRRPDLEVVLSSTTTSGVAVAERSLPGRAAFLQPLDLGPLVGRALRRVDPAALVLVELELWPGLSHRARAAGVPLLVANGRISARSASRFARSWVRRLVGMECVDVYAVQNDEYRDRLVALGVTADRIVVTGNVKADATPVAAPAGLRAQLGFSTEEKLVVAGSTHPGEVALIARAVAVAARRIDAVVRLIVAPRHHDRIAIAERELEGAGLLPVRLTALRGGATVRPNSALVIDTMGELAGIYGIADVAIVGGSLVAGIGGHNVFEPALAGAPTLVGPWNANVRSDAQFLASVGALTIVDPPESLADRLADRLAAGRAGAAPARAALERTRGASARTVDLVLELCDNASNAGR